MKRVAIVGGGYAGILLAQALDRVADVTLIEPRQAFVHNVAAIRAVVDPGLLDQIVLPYDRLLKRGRVIRDRALAIEDGAVRLAAKGVVEADYIVVATGSGYALPFKPAGDDLADFRAASLAAHEAVKAARSIAIVGAGPVGVELAGEIASAMPGKTVTLVCSTPTLFPDYPPALGRRLQKDLKRLGVGLRLGVRALGPTSADRPGPGPVKLSDGSTLEADLAFQVTGARADADLLRALTGVHSGPSGRVTVDGWLRPSDRPNLFALGDVVDAGDHMTIVAATRQAPWLAKTLTALMAGKRIEKLSAYTPWPAPPILIPLGARHGASVLPFTKQGMVFGPGATAAIKGKTLFIPRYRKDFGL